MIGCSGTPRLAVVILILLFWQSGWSDQLGAIYPTTRSPEPRARIALIIDDLGNVLHAGKRTTALKGPVACAVLPHTPFGSIIARQAHFSGKEVLLHLPLQPIGQVGLTQAGTIDIDNTRDQLVRIFEADIASIPYVVGVNNHMGSLLTRHPGHMKWLMGALKARGNLFFVDSYTTDSSVALQLAREHEIPASRRDVFLDNVPTWAAIDREFARLRRRAKKNGTAIGIGHPYPVTLNYLEYALPGLVSDGIELVTVAALIEDSTSAR
jgi:polysaccharide deacetylase 2 family uncharacterized protein YibQ